MKIKRCHFCKNKDVFVFEKSMCRFSDYHVYCDLCQSSGPVVSETEYRNAKELAVKYWNEFMYHKR